MDVTHRQDGDGGYTLVQEIRRWLKQLDPTARSEAFNTLFHFVERRDNSLWGVALSVLAEERPEKISGRLEQLFNAPDLDQERKDALTLALLQMHRKEFSKSATIYIRETLRQGHRAVLPSLAALAAIDKNACLFIASEYFGRALAQARGRDIHNGYIGAFVRNFLETDKALFLGLINQTKRVNPGSGEILAKMFAEYLSRPILGSEIDDMSIAKLRGEILNDS